MVKDNRTKMEISNTQLTKYHSHPFPLLTFICKNTARTMFIMCYQPAEKAYLETSRRYTLSDLFGYSRCLFKNRLLNDVTPRTTCIIIPNSPRSSHSFFTFEYYSLTFIFFYYEIFKYLNLNYTLQE